MELAAGRIVAGIDSDDIVGFAGAGAAVAAAEVADAADADVVEVDAAAVAIPDASSLQDYPVHMGNQRAEAADCGPT